MNKDETWIRIYSYIFLRVLPIAPVVTEEGNGTERNIKDQLQFRSALSQLPRHIHSTEAF